MVNKATALRERLEAEEALELVDALAIGTGVMPKDAAKQQLHIWKERSRDESAVATPARRTAADLEKMGIKVFRSQQGNA